MASPTCPAFHFLKVQDSWDLVATKGKSYAEAIRPDPSSVNSILQCGRQQKSVSQKSVNSARADRDDVIEAAVVEKVQCWTC